MIAYWLDYGFSFVQSEAQFRVPIALQGAFAVVTIALVLILPESPRWLLKKGRSEDVRGVLGQLSVLPHGDTREATITAYFDEIRLALKEEQEALPKDKNGNVISGVRACFTNGKGRYFHRVMLGIGGQFMQQLCVSSAGRSHCSWTNDAYRSDDTGYQPVSFREPSRLTSCNILTQCCGLDNLPQHHLL